MAELPTGQWVKFFKQAGIPEKAAATYALTFAENRIQSNMLLDLNKEYLRDMGITLMGDVIAILRHAKFQHEEMVTEKLLVTNNRDKPSVSSKAVEVVYNIPNPSLPQKKTTASPHMVDRLPRETKSVVVAAKPKVPTKESGLQNDSIHIRKAPLPQPGSAVPVKRKCKPTISTLETITIIDDTPEPKRPRRVSPEEEGGYKIKMPSGTTPRSQQILAKSKELARRKTVFQRLGSGTSSSSSPNGTKSSPCASAVSSTTSVSAPSFKVTGLSTGTSKSETAPLARSQSSSVFRRLGDKQVSSSTQCVVKREEALPYAGIFKSPERVTHRIVQKPVEKVTMIADSVETRRTEVRDRLGNLMKTSSNQHSQMERKKRVEDYPTPGIKSRLGAAKLTSKIDSSVKDNQKIPSVKSSTKPTSYSSPKKNSVKVNHQVKGVFSRLGSCADS